MEIPIGSLVTAAATVVCVVIANMLTFKRSSREKIWDLRRQAYGAILSALATVERICDSADEYIQEDEERYFHGDDYRRHNSQIAEQMSIARRRFADDYLVFSDEFVALFEKFTRALSDGDLFATPPEEHDHFVEVLRECRLLLLSKARSEINVDGRWTNSVASLFGRLNFARAT